MSHKRWIVADSDKDKASELSEKLNIDPFIAFLLVSRGVDNSLSASEFLSDDCTYSSPFSLKDMDKAVERINRALDCSERICIYGDYDCDGVTSTALLFTFLQSLGADVIYFIPDRINDGYGMNKTAIDKIKSYGTQLIITVDNGISAIDEADYVYSLGMELVVTDHHQLVETLPRAEAVINPHRQYNSIQFHDFAGVGVAFKLACALYDGDVSEMLEQYADLVAIGTIGDVVALKSENRGFVKEGIKLINSDSRIGLVALKEVAGISQKELSGNDIAFGICPRINAAGRMDNASRAVELLVSDDFEDAKFKAQQLNDENVHRHEVETNILNDINSKIEENPNLVGDRVIVLDGDGYHKGVIGIVASAVCETYGKPAIIIGVDENGNATGSARSIEGFNIFDAISSCSELLTHYGGHPLAAGLGIKKDDIDSFRRQINSYARENFPVMPAQSLELACKLSPFYLNTELVDSLSLLEPYGAENPQPIFGLYKMKLLSITPLGDGKHIRLEVQKQGKSFRIVKFRTSPEEFAYKVGDLLDFAVKISKNLFKGKYYLSIQAVDIRRNGIDDDKYYLEKTDYQLYNLGNKNNTQLYPDRAVLSTVYRFLKQNGGWNYSLDELYFSLDGLTYGQLCFSLDAFEEAGLIKRNGKITLCSVNGKADLEQTQVIKTLKGRTSLE